MIRSKSLIFCCEQLAGREGDQRQLVDRRAVLLLRRAQDGEVDEVDVGVGLQQVAPGALARMRLAGDQQHAQLLADALDRQHGAVVDRGQLARQRLDLDLDDVRAAMLDPDRRARTACRCGRLRRPISSPSRRTVTTRVAGAAALHHLGADRLVLADDAEARRLQELDLPVALVRMAGDQRVQRRLEAELRRSRPGCRAPRRR